MHGRFTREDKVILFCTLIFVIVLTIGLIFLLPSRKQVNQKVSQIQSSLGSNGAVSEDTTNTPAIDSSTLPTASESPTADCHTTNGLPDPICTPGVIDPRVTQSDISQTICVSGYTKTVRPSASVTNRMKLISMQQYGFSDSPHNYEYDHLISLELGGAPQDTRNLWPEPGASPNPKDKIEDKLHSLVCNGSLTLADAQHRIATNWETALNGL